MADNASILRRALHSVLGTALDLLARSRQARSAGTLRLPGLSAPAEVIRDRWGVPHIYASSTRDLFFAQGYAHGQDRLWQMDFQRRLASGRLAEILGADALPVDRWLRILGLRRAAKGCLLQLPPGLHADLDAYAAGVNAAIAHDKLPVEFVLLRYRPEPWSALDTLVWAKMMAWDLSVNWESELLRGRLVAHLGPEAAAALEPGPPSRVPRIVPPGVDYSCLGQEALRGAREARRLTGPTAQEGLGSNGWVVAGSRTTSGAPILANDMHLLLGMPAIWYENHLDGGDLHVTGVNFPGVPGVVAGHNGHVAWGFTNGFADVQDLYVEHLQRPGDGRVRYEFRGEWHDATVIREEIPVRGQETAVEEVIVTCHGPVINALAPEQAGDEPLALRWTALEPDLMFQALFGMNRARDCAEFREALRDWAVPVQNVVYADTAGDIAYTLAGRIPIRARGDGGVPVPGWTGEYEWLGYIPYEELPHLHNPPQGYVATANNRVVDDDYPYHLSCDYITGDRAQRIVELIEARSPVDLAYTQAMQLDQLSAVARVVAASVVRLGADWPELAPALELWREWDGTLGVDSAAAALYEAFAPRFLELALRDQLGDLTPRYLGLGPTPVLAETSIFASRAWEWLEHALAAPEDAVPWRSDIARRALAEAVAYLRAELGPEPAAWAWGRLHRLTYGHVLGRGRALAHLFSRGPYPIGGDGTTLWATGGGKVDLKKETLVGPPFRFIADLSDLRRTVGVLVPGQSGRPGSSHYDDQVDAWFQGAYHPMLYDRKDVEREATDRLSLLPPN